MARPKKDEAPAAAAQAPDSLLVKTTELLFMRDNFISGLSHLESGVHELRRAYISQFNTLLPEGHPGKIALNTIPFFNPNNAGLPGLAGGAPGAPVPGVTGVPGMLAPEANMKRKRKPHDPHAPKRALTSYFLFMQHNKPAIKEEHPDWTAQQISDESERRWSNINEKERADYEYMYQVDLARYYKQKECYERGEPVPDISADEAKRLYQEHLKSGVPFKGRKGKKESRRVEIPNEDRPEGASSDSDDDDSDEAEEPSAAAPALVDEEEEEEEESEPEPQAPPPKSNKRQKTGKEPASATRPNKKASAKESAAAAAAMSTPPTVEKEKKGKPGRKAKAEPAPAPTPAPVAPVAAESSPAKSGSTKKGRKRKSQADDA